jgi:hypothetical protein
MKTLLAISLLCALSVGCGPSAQEKKANSPECLAAKNEAAERKAKAGSLNLEIQLKKDERRKQLENLRLEDQIAELQGRPIKNRKAEALLETAISTNEMLLKYDMESTSTAIDQYLIQAACEMPPAKRN